ncbi:acetate kinase [Candidatus Peregrinibacteria bacterium]|nr:acetate kinase [Candidatus Peregrinibacteria bacterium]
MKIIVLNAGSSSLRFELFESVGKNLHSLFQGHFDNHGEPIKDFDRAVKDAVQSLLDEKIIKNLAEIKAIGHRVVHGGELYTKPTKVTPAVISAIKKLSKLAPLHNPPNLAGILACKKLFPKIPQVAVFDTAFHQTMPEEAFLYGLPYSFYKKLGIRRYGFHGTSHQYVFEEARKKLGIAKTQKTITCHLGNGCSMAAILDGKVVDTSMGFTPLEGLPMGTRTGDFDPAIIFYLLENGMSLKEIQSTVNKKSGLLGISEMSSDVRDLWATYKKGDKRAIRTLKWFAYRIAKYVGSYAAALGGLDCLVFTGGIGENAEYIRKWVLEHLDFLGDKEVLVIKTNEEKKIAEATVNAI